MGNTNCACNQEYVGKEVIMPKVLSSVSIKTAMRGYAVREHIKAFQKNHSGLIH